jgi:hypothetical protein
LVYTVRFFPFTDESRLIAKHLGSFFETGIYGDFDFDIMAVGKERKHALRYMRFLVLPFPGKFLLYGVKIDLFFLEKDEIRTFGNK